MTENTCKRAFIYRHLPDEGYKNHLTAQDLTPNTKILKRGIFPGMDGSPDILIEHYQVDSHLLVTLTYRQISVSKLEKIKREIRSKYFNNR
jgi:hypothetical protein